MKKEKNKWRGFLRIDVTRYWRNGATGRTSSERERERRVCLFLTFGFRYVAQMGTRGCLSHGQRFIKWEDGNKRWNLAVVQISASHETSEAVEHRFIGILDNSFMAWPRFPHKKKIKFAKCPPGNVVVIRVGLTWFSDIPGTTRGKVSTKAIFDWLLNSNDVISNEWKPCALAPGAMMLGVETVHSGRANGTTGSNQPKRTFKGRKRGYANHKYANPGSPRQWPSAIVESHSAPISERFGNL